MKNLIVKIIKLIVVFIMIMGLVLTSVGYFQYKKIVNDTPIEIKINDLVYIEIVI